MIAARALLLLALLLGAPAVALAQTEAHDVLGYQGANGLWHAYDTTGAGIPVTGAGGGGGAVTLPTTPTIANGSGVVPTQGGIALSATNGGYTNILQGNAVLATGNPIFAQITAGSASIGGVSLAPATSGGLSVASAIVANNTTSVAIKASAGQLFGVDAYSISAATPVWIKLYNTAQGSTTCGSGTPVARILIPATGATGSGQIWHETNGDAYSTAITYCVTAGIADADTTSPAANTYVVNFHYK